ncbi:CoA-transferase subunit beta [[Eubacterium] cellulosolvens]
MKEKRYAKEFTRKEVMVVAGAHELRDGEIGLIGVGLPQVSGILAKFTHAPKLKVLLELGIVDPRPVHTSSGLGDPRIWYGATCMTDWLDIMGMTLHRGIVDVGFLGGIQVDEYGNLNSTLTGTLDNPIRHFTGSGGANDIASLAKRTILIMKHEKRRFSKRVDYITSPGYINGANGRKKEGLREGGPAKVITDLAVMGFDDETRRMKLLSLHPGVTLNEVVENTGFDLIIPEQVLSSPPPTIDEQKIIRTIADSTGIFTGWRNVS